MDVEVLLIRHGPHVLPAVGVVVEMIDATTIATGERLDGSHVLATATTNNAGMATFDSVGSKVFFRARMAEPHYCQVIGADECVHPEDFGAKRDGVTDDIEAINEAIAEVAAQGGGRVCFSAGTYMISSSINVSDNVVLYGVGSNATIIKALAGFASDGMVAAASVPTHGVSIQGIKLDCDGIAARGVDGPAASSGFGINFSMSDVQIIDATEYGIFSGINTSAMWYIENVLIQNSTGTPMTAGVWIGVNRFYSRGLTVWGAVDGIIARNTSYSDIEARIEDVRTGFKVLASTGACTWSNLELTVSDSVGTPFAPMFLVDTGGTFYGNRCRLHHSNSEVAGTDQFTYGIDLKVPNASGGIRGNYFQLVAGIGVAYNGGAAIRFAGGLVTNNYFECAAPEVATLVSGTLPQTNIVVNVFSTVGSVPPAGSGGTGAGTGGSGTLDTSGGNGGFILNADTSESGTQVAYLDFKHAGVLVGNIAVNEATAGTPLELNSAVSNNISMVAGGGKVMIGTASAPSTMYLLHQVKALSGDLGFAMTVGSEANPRTLLQSDRISFGPGGATAVDVSIVRTGATTLSFQTGGSERVRIDNGGITRDALLTTTGDMYYASAASTPARLAIGANGTIMQVSGGLPTWQTLATAAAHVMLDGSVHTDSVAQGVTRGSLIYGNSTPKWDELVIGANGAIIRSNGTDVAWTINPAIAGWTRVGSASNPSNTTAGDFTAIRGMFGDDAAHNSNTYLAVRRVATPPTGNTFLFAIRSLVTPDATAGVLWSSNRTALSIQPTAAAGGTYQGLDFAVTHDSGAFNLTGVVYAVNGEIRQEVAGTTVTKMVALHALTRAVAGTVTTFYGSEIQIGSGADAGTVTTFVGYTLVAPVAGMIITTLQGVLIPNLGTANVTNAIGVDIAKQSGAATLNIGLRNAGRTVFSPGAAQTLAAGTAIVADATVVMINSVGAVTLTGTPTIADGQDGQIVTIINVDSADAITLQDETALAGSNLRLAGAANYAMGPRDTLTLVFSSTLGDWIEIARSNN